MRGIGLGVRPTVDATPQQDGHQFQHTRRGRRDTSRRVASSCLELPPSERQVGRPVRAGPRSPVREWRRTGLPQRLALPRGPPSESPSGVGRATRPPFYEVAYRGRRASTRQVLPPRRPPRERVEVRRRGEYGQRAAWEHATGHGARPGRLHAWSSRVGEYRGRVPREALRQPRRAGSQSVSCGNPKPSQHPCCPFHCGVAGVTP